MATLYGIGVGPGDPELMTVKAIKTILNCDIVILPTEPKEDCYAYQIIKQVIPEIDQKELLCRHFPMTRDEKILSETHEKIYQEILQFLIEGKNVAFLTIGDPSLYSTFGYMQEKAKRDDICVEIIAGVPSICAVFARLGIPFAENKDEIHIIPGAGNAEKALQYPGTKIFMKSGKQLVTLKQELMKQKDNVDIYAVSNCGLPNETVTHGVEELDELSGYLTIVIVKS